MQPIAPILRYGKSEDHRDPPSSGLINAHWCIGDGDAPGAGGWKIANDRRRPDHGSATNVIQAPKLEPRIMRYELSDDEWTAIKPVLPNKPRSPMRRIGTKARMA